MSEAQREIVAVMFTDVSGYSTLAQRDEALALKLLELKRGLADPVIAAHGGRLVKTIGELRVPGKPARPGWSRVPATAKLASGDAALAVGRDATCPS